MSGPTTVKAALAALHTLKPGTAAYAKAYSVVTALREASATADGDAYNVVRETPCAFHTCVRLFAGEKGASDHRSGRKILKTQDDMDRVAAAIRAGWIDGEWKIGDRNPLFCQGAADYQASKAIAAQR